MTVLAHVLTATRQTDRAPGVTVKGRAVLRLTTAAEQLQDGRQLLVVPATISRQGDRWVTRGRSFASAFDAVLYAYETLSEVVWSADG